MSDPRRRKADNEIKASQGGNASGAMTPQVAPLQPIQPRSQQPHSPAPLRPQNDLYNLPLLRPQSKTSQQQRSGKIAIPRMHREPDGASATGSSGVGEKHRVNHACEPCRHRKTKCSGERPSCKHCEDCRIRCIYADGKRDRTRKQLGNMAGKVKEYERLLRDLSLRVEGADQILIRKTLEQESMPDEEELSSTTSFRELDKSGGFYAGVEGDRVYEGDGETHASARAGSTESLDHVNEDFNHSIATRATGFMGKNSELTWMQRLKHQTAFGSDESDEEAQTQPFADGHTSRSLYQDIFGSRMNPVNESTYHCDDLTILLPDLVDPHEIPPRQTSDALFHIYLDTVYPAFPIIGKTNFTNQYQRFFDTPRIKTGDNWLAILNLIFAIGARYSHLVRAEWRGDERDHLIYFTRARMLGFNSESVLGHADLQRVQITGLMSFYLLSINQINRAWAISGIAIRQAYTLGLNLQNESKNVNDSSKEVRYRVWWALCSTERLLAVMTGRPTSIVETDCSVPLPLPLDEESFFSVKPSTFNSHTIQLLRRYSSQDSPITDNVASTPSSAHSSKTRTSPTDRFSPVSQQSSLDHSQVVNPCYALYFLHHTKLSIVTSEVLNRLYRVGTMSLSWAQIQAIITSLEGKVDRWRITLPSVFDFTKRQRDQQFHRQRVSLGFFYYSSLIIVSRPCLCMVNRRIPNQSTKSKEFNRATAAKCVYAARDMLELLPDEPNSIGLYKVAPWWCLVHHLVQAVTVLMLEVSYRSDHLPHEVEQILDSAKKAVHWLRSMSEDDLAASRAWRMCDDMLRKVAPKVGRSVDDLPTNSSLRPQTPLDGMHGHMVTAEDQHGIDSMEPYNYLMNYTYDQNQGNHEALGSIDNSNFMHQPDQQTENQFFPPYTFPYYDGYLAAQTSNPGPPL